MISKVEDDIGVFKMSTKYKSDHSRLSDSFESLTKRCIKLERKVKYIEVKLAACKSNENSINFMKIFLKCCLQQNNLVFTGKLKLCFE